MAPSNPTPGRDPGETGLPLNTSDDPVNADPAASAPPVVTTETAAVADAAALPKTAPVDPAALVLITHPGLEGGAVTTVPRRAFDDLWSDKGYVLVDDEAEVVAADTGQLFLKDEARSKYQPVTSDGVRSAVADLANNTTVTPGPTVPGSKA